MGVVGEDRRSASPARSARRWPSALQRDRQQAGRHLLARGDDGVIFAQVVQRRGLLAPGDQLVGLAGHGRDDDRDLVAGLDLALHMARDIADALEVATEVPPNFMTRRGIG